MKRRVVVFDFDGTLTLKDTLLEFIKFTCGKTSFYKGFLLYLPMLVLMKLRLYPNWRAKEKIFGYFFKGWALERFQSAGATFANRIENFCNFDVLEMLSKHISEGDKVYVITASVEEWVRPWCRSKADVVVIGTQVETDSEGRINGRFKTKNCYGREKVNRLLLVEPDRKDYELYAYGDSRGDKEMIEYADYGLYINKK